MKKTLKKLSLNKKQVSQLTKDAVVGGSTLCTVLRCGGSGPIETIDLTHCWGNYICEFRTSL